MRLSSVAATCGVLFLLSCSDDVPVFIDAATDANNADANAPLGMLPSSVDLSFGDCGGMKSTTFTVTNSGNATLTYSLAFSDPAFTVTPQSGEVLAGASTTFTITGTVAAGATPGQTLTVGLTATTNLPGSPHTIPVTVTPRGARITITPPSVGFGQVEAGTTSAPSTVVVANTGNAQAIITMGNLTGEFARIFGANGAITLQGGQNAQASFTYHPNGVGADGVNTSVSVSGVHCGVAPSNIPVTGEGAVTGGVLVQGTPVAFGDIACGATAGTATVTLMNTANLAVPYSASFLTDAENDHLRYSVAPASGMVPAAGSTTLTITRMAIGLPAQPRAYDAVLRINTTLPTSTNTDVPVTQTLSGPFLVVTPSSTNFGFASVGNSRTAPVSIQNTGNTMATITGTTADPFALQLPATVAAATTTPGTMTFTPDALGTLAGSATINATGACSAAAALTFTAGDGPEVEMYTYGADGTCPVGATLTGGIFVQNTGNQPLSMTCAETSTTDLAPQFSPSPLGVSPGSSATLDVTVATGSPIRSGVTSATFRCTTNEPVDNAHNLAYARDIFGADLALSAAQPLEFTCGVTERRSYTITNSASSANGTFVQPTSSLVFPLGHDFTQLTLDPGDSDDNDVTTYGGGSAMPSAPVFVPAHGVPDPCAGTAAPGDTVFTGFVGVNTGSSSNVCSVTPATLPVILKMGTPQ